jgi:DNA repair protein RadD
MILPTGAGKSLVIASIASQLDKPVLVLQPTKELLSQNYDKYLSYGNNAAIYSASKGIKEIGEVTFATIGSIYKKSELFQDFGYLIIDECHLTSPQADSMYQKLLTETDLKLLGLTASPFRLKSYSFPVPHSKLCFLDRMRPRIFKDVIHVTQIQEMTSERFWSPLIYVQEVFDKSKLQINTTGADFTEKSILKQIEEQNVLRKAIEVIKGLKKEGRKQILIFAPSIKAAHYIALKTGLKVVSSETDKKDREKWIEEFATQKTWGIININVLSVGFDSPTIDAIVDLYPTMSLARYYQRLGRGVRIHPDKKDCKIVDLVGNFEMFGKIEDIVVNRNKKGLWELTSNKEPLTNVSLVKIDEKQPLEELENNEMTFGKYEGQKFKDVPKWYLKWVVNNLSETFEKKDLFRYIRSAI